MRGLRVTQVVSEKHIIYVFVWPKLLISYGIDINLFEISEKSHKYLKNLAEKCKETNILIESSTMFVYENKKEITIFDIFK